MHPLRSRPPPRLHVLLILLPNGLKFQLMILLSWPLHGGVVVWCCCFSTFDTNSACWCCSLKVRTTMMLFKIISLDDVQVQLQYNSDADDDNGDPCSWSAGPVLKS